MPIVSYIYTEPMLIPMNDMGNILIAQLLMIDI